VDTPAWPCWTRPVKANPWAVNKALTSRKTTTTMITGQRHRDGAVSDGCETDTQVRLDADRHFRLILDTPYEGDQDMRFSRVPAAAATLLRRAGRAKRRGSAVVRRPPPLDPLRLEAA
jgi:hypothetical protein